MKKLLFSAILIFSLLAFIGCMKDQDFENQKYGIQVTDNSPGISFPQATSSPVSFSLNSSTTSQSVSTELSVESANAASTDISVTLTTDTVGFAAAGLTQLPASAYSVALTQVIPAGKRMIPVTVTFPNTTTLNPTAKYGIALTINTASSGYQVVSNMRKVILSFNIKNIYDGVYSVVSGSVQRYTAPGVPEPAGGLNGNLAGNPDVYLITTGANSVGIPASSNTGSIYWAFGNNSQVAGIDNVRIAIDPATNLVTTSALGNATLANWEGKENRYDPATKTFYLNFRWNPTSNRREYSIVLKYKGPR